MTIQTGANLYTQGFGSRPEDVEIPFFQTRNPTSSDVKYPLGKFWMNTSNNTVWALTSFATSNGVISANWTWLASASSSGIQGVFSDSFEVTGPNLAGNVGIRNGGGITTTTDTGANAIFLTNNSYTVNWVTTSIDLILQPNEGVICVGGGVLTITMPSVSVPGDMIAVYLDGATGFTTSQSSGMSLRLGTMITTTGAGGSITGVNPGDGFTAVCVQSNTRWLVVNCVGNLSFV